MTDVTRQRAARTDKQRNRSHILGVAEQYFTEHGVSDSMNAIAKLAGVGAGTLYRHFPNRDALLAALLRARSDELKARRDAIRLEVHDSTAALAQWLEALGEWATAFNGLPEPLRLALNEGSSPLALTCQGYVTITDEFLSAAQGDGGARPAVRGKDLFLNVLAISWVREAALADEASGGALEDIMRAGWAM
ncbi:TetR/AcrR family transcriptional regulator [Nocardia salmonicida]|uniref:TetR/AcrR family transcriptional regulator n=1 Tax=Nocardia salmonicida TaxID=53431 RepID=UPI0033E65CB0